MPCICDSIALNKFIPESRLKGCCFLCLQGLHDSTSSFGGWKLSNRLMVQVLMECLVWKEAM